MIIFYYCQSYYSRKSPYFFCQSPYLCFGNFEPIHRVLRNISKIQFYKNNFTCCWEGPSFPTSKFLAQFPYDTIKVFFCPSILLYICASKIRATFIGYRDWKHLENYFSICMWHTIREPNTRFLIVN